MTTLTFKSKNSTYILVRGLVRKSSTKISGGKTIELDSANTYTGTNPGNAEEVAIKDLVVGNEYLIGYSVGELSGFVVAKLVSKSFF